MTDEACEDDVVVSCDSQNDSRFSVEKSLL